MSDVVRRADAAVTYAKSPHSLTDHTCISCVRWHTVCAPMSHSLAAVSPTSLTTAPHDVQQWPPEPGVREVAGRFFDLGLLEGSTTAAAAFMTLLLGLLRMRGGR